MGELENLAAITLFHGTVGFKKRHVVGGAFDARHNGELVVELDAGRPHLVTNACTLNAGIEIVADLSLVVAGEFTAQKSCYILRFNGMDSGVNDVVIQWQELSLAMKQDIGRIFDLHETPVVTVSKQPLNRAELFGPAVKPSVQLFGIKAIRQFLSSLKIIDSKEGVIGHLVSNAGLGQASC